MQLLSEAQRQDQGTRQKFHSERPANAGHCRKPGMRGVFGSGRQSDNGAALQGRDECNTVPQHTVAPEVATVAASRNKLRDPLKDRSRSLAHFVLPLSKHAPPGRFSMRERCGNGIGRAVSWGTGISFFLPSAAEPTMLCQQAQAWRSACVLERVARTGHQSGDTPSMKGVAG